MESWIGPGLYVASVLVSGAFIIAENRRPQATFAWIFLFILLPGIGLIIYLMFGRDHQAFSRPRGMITHDLNEGPQQILGPLIEAQTETLKYLESQPGPQGRLAQLVRSNSHSALTKE